MPLLTCNHLDTQTSGILVVDLQTSFDSPLPRLLPECSPLLLLVRCWSLWSLWSPQVPPSSKRLHPQHHAFLELGWPQTPRPISFRSPYYCLRRRSTLLLVSQLGLEYPSLPVPPSLNLTSPSVPLTSTSTLLLSSPPPASTRSTLSGSLPVPLLRHPAPLVHCYLPVVPPASGLSQGRFQLAASLRTSTRPSHFLICDFFLVDFWDPYTLSRSLIRVAHIPSRGGIYCLKEPIPDYIPILPVELPRESLTCCAAHWIRAESETVREAPSPASASSCRMLCTGYCAAVF